MALVRILLQIIQIAWLASRFKETMNQCVLRFPQKSCRSILSYHNKDWTLRIWSAKYASTVSIKYHFSYCFLRSTSVLRNNHFLNVPLVFQLKFSNVIYKISHVWNHYRFSVRTLSLNYLLNVTLKNPISLPNCIALSLRQNLDSAPSSKWPVLYINISDLISTARSP